MKSSKAQILAKFHKIPVLRFEDQELTFGAAEFMQACFTEARGVLKNTIFESRLDSAFFNEEVLSGYNRQGVQFSASVPFERFPASKAMVESRKRWKKIGFPMVVF